MGQEPSQGLALACALLGDVGEARADEGFGQVSARCQDKPRVAQPRATTARGGERLASAWIQDHSDEITLVVGCGDAD